MAFQIGLCILWLSIHSLSFLKSTSLVIYSGLLPICNQVATSLLMSGDVASIYPQVVILLFWDLQQLLLYQNPYPLPQHHAVSFSYFVVERVFLQASLFLICKNGHHDQILLLCNWTTGYVLEMSLSHIHLWYRYLLYFLNYMMSEIAMLFILACDCLNMAALGIWK